MKKSNVNKLMAVALAGMMMVTGCSASNIKASEVAKGEKSYTIGISQLAEHPSLDEAKRGFVDGLKELDVDVNIVYRNAQGDIPNTVTIAQKFVKDKVDLIYAIATPSAQSARQTTDDIPILFSAVTDPVQTGIVQDWKDVGGNITGTSDKAPIKDQLKMYKEIDPNIKTIGIIYSTSETNSEIQLKEVKELAPELELDVVEVGVTTVSDMPQALDSLLTKIDALYIITDNLVASSMQLVANKLIEYDKVSICSFEESSVDEGILITNGLSYYELGKQTAQMAKEILVDGKSVLDIPVGLAEKTITTVNVKTLRTLGLDENLPIIKNAVKVGE